MPTGSNLVKDNLYFPFSEYWVLVTSVKIEEGDEMLIFNLGT